MRRNGSERIGGRAWVFGDDIDTDVLAPGLYMKAPMEELASHCLEAVDPGFARGVKPGDIVVAGRNFGMGSSREQAAQALITLGVSAVLAKSFAGIFHRNALNLGLFALELDETDKIGAEDELRLVPETGEVTNVSTGKTLHAEPLAGHLAGMVRDGGLIPHLKKRLQAEGRRKEKASG